MSSRNEILQWVNNLFNNHIVTPFPSIQEIPAKAVGRILNAMFGNHLCPLHEIMFDDETPMTSLRNRRKVLQLARAVGYDGKLDATRWAEGKDFVNELCFWRWLRTQEPSHPISPQSDFSLRPAGGGGGGPCASSVPPLHPPIIPSPTEQQASAGPSAVLPPQPSPLPLAELPASSRKRVRDLIPNAEEVASERALLCSASEAAIKCQSVIDELSAKGCSSSVSDITLHNNSCERCSDTSRELLTITRDNIARMEKAKVRVIEACKERSLPKLMLALKDV